MTPDKSTFLRRFAIFLLVHLVSEGSLALSVDTRPPSRRRALISTSSWWVLLTTASTPSDAAQGAAELDLEYYLKDLLGGNKREGTVAASPAPPMPPPRRLNDPLASLLLNQDCTVDCFTTLALVEEIHLSQPNGRGPGGDPRILERQVENRMKEIRQQSKAAFYQRAPWKDETIFDQYYFDVTSYALWKTAATFLPNSYARDQFMRRMGSYVLSNLQKYSYLKTTTPRNLVQSTAGIQEVLDLFVKDGIIKGYRLGDRPIQSNKGGTKSNVDIPVFLDEIDDEAFESGGSIDCLMSIFEPATLGASLQITGEQSRFAPDFIGPTIAAYWKAMGVSCTWETYFVDPEYRPNPKDYFPNEQLFQFTLTKVS